MKIKLSNIADIIMGQSPEGNSYNNQKNGLPLLNGAADYKGNNFNPKKFTNAPLKIAKKGDILIGIRATIGNLAIADKDYCIGRGLAAIRVSNEVSKKYVTHFLSQQINKLIYNSSGSTIKGIVKEDLFDMAIPLPSLPSQLKIAEILDVAEAIKNENEELIKKYDDLAQSIFIDMFGDPIRNDKNWGESTLDKVCLKITDGTHDTPKRLREGNKFITGKHIKPYFIDYENSDYVTPEIHDQIYRRCNPQKGDILYTNIGVNYATAAMNTVDYEFSMKNVALLKYNRELLSGRYLEHLLNNSLFKSRLQTLTGIGGAQQFLSLTQIKSIKILLPPISLQLKFDNIISSIYKSIEISNRSLTASEILFDSLIQKAFSGELLA